MFFGLLRHGLFVLRWKAIKKVIIVKQHEMFLDCSVGSHEESYNYLEIIFSGIYPFYACGVCMKAAYVVWVPDRISH